MKKLICVALLALASLAASAQQVVTGSGLVTGTTPTGIYLTTNTGTSFVPYSSSTFTINGQPIEARFVVDGMNVSVYPIGYNNQYGNHNTLLCSPAPCVIPVITGGRSELSS